MTKLSGWLRHWLSPTIVEALGGNVSPIFHFEVNTKNMSMHCLITVSLVKPGWPA